MPLNLVFSPAVPFRFPLVFFLSFPLPPTRNYRRTKPSRKPKSYLTLPSLSRTINVLLRYGTVHAKHVDFREKKGGAMGEAVGEEEQVLIDGGLPSWAQSHGEVLLYFFCVLVLLSVRWLCKL